MHLLHEGKLSPEGTNTFVSAIQFLHLVTLEMRKQAYNAGKLEFVSDLQKLQDPEPSLAIWIPFDELVRPGTVRDAAEARQPPEATLHGLRSNRAGGRSIRHPFRGPKLPCCCRYPPDCTPIPEQAGDRART